MTTITIERTILDRLIEAWDSTVLPTHRDGMMQERMEDLRAELAKPVEPVEPAAWRTFDGEGGYMFRAYEDNEDYQEWFEKRNPHHKGWVEPLYLHPPTPAWHDAPEVAALKAERDELLKLINRRKIHPHDFPLEIFIADLSTRTANVLRAEFDSFRHTDGTYDIEPPFTVRHLLMFSRQEIKKWPGIGKKGLNEIEENLRARGLQLWHAHDDRSLRLLREHKSYFVDPAKAKGVAA